MKITKQNLSILKLITNRMLVAEALRKGYDVDYISASASESISGITRATKNGREIVFCTDETTLAPVFGQKTANNKWLTNNLLTHDGVSTPPTFSVSIKETDLQKYIDQLREIVVKPLDTNHGDGISIGVKTAKELRAALDFAAQFSKIGRAIVQKQITGDEYRFLVLREKVIAVSRRRPPFVVGDGKKTVRELLRELNADPLRGENHGSPLTRVSESEVARENRTDFLDKVLTLGEKVELLKTSNLSRGGFAEDFTDRASSKIKDMAAKAAKSCALGFAGVDVITTDIENGDASNSFVIEVNKAPGLRMHEFPSIGQPRPVVKMLFREMEKHATRIGGNPLGEVGRFAYVGLPTGQKKIPARIDTGARTTAIWASDICENDGVLSWQFFTKDSPYFTGEICTAKSYEKSYVMSSNGQRQLRYRVPITLEIQKRKIRTFATLANRAHAAFPILVGCNTLSGKFLVNVQKCPAKLAKIYNNWYNKSGLKGGKK